MLTKKCQYEELVNHPPGGGKLLTPRVGHMCRPPRGCTLLTPQPGHVSTLKMFFTQITPQIVHMSHPPEGDTVFTPQDRHTHINISLTPQVGQIITWTLILCLNIFLTLQLEHFKFTPQEQQSKSLEAGTHPPTGTRAWIVQYLFPCLRHPPSTVLLLFSPIRNYACCFKHHPGH